jgi:hypothetical protein
MGDQSPKPVGKQANQTVPARQDRRWLAGIAFLWRAFRAPPRPGSCGASGYRAVTFTVGRPPGKWLAKNSLMGPMNMARRTVPQLC